jgi:lipoprotein
LSVERVVGLSGLATQACFCRRKVACINACRAQALTELGKALLFTAARLLQLTDRLPGAVVLVAQAAHGGGTLPHCRAVAQLLVQGLHSLPHLRQILAVLPDSLLLAAVGANITQLGIKAMQRVAVLVKLP